MSNILSADSVTKYFGDYAALKGVNLQVPEGSIFGLLGPNGAGKTTLIRILTHITAPDSGTVSFQGRPLHEAATEQIGYLPEERGLYRKMKVWEQAVYLCQLKGLNKVEAIVRLKEWFKRLHMTDWWNKPVHALSKGMQQRLQFVITVAHQPKLLILDEPFSGFDPVHAEELKKEILRLKDEGTTIILSTHNMSSVEELCENICLIHQGDVILSGSLSEAKQQFSKSLFEIEFKGSQVGFATALGHQFEIVKINEHSEVKKAVIKAHAQVGSNDLLKALLSSVEIIGFKEQLPSMNDIFIDLVKEKPESANSAA